MWPSVTKKAPRSGCVSSGLTFVGEKSNQWIFRVRPDATKPEIKAAVELMFKVEVLGVQTANVMGKETKRFGRAVGARAETMMGLSGLGDLILTCSSPQSRNFSYGVALGKGVKPDGKLAEGAFTAPVLLEMARAQNIEMPISAAIAAVLTNQMSVDQAIESLLTRPIKAEG